MFSYVEAVEAAGTYAFAEESSELQGAMQEQII